MYFVLGLFVGLCQEDRGVDSLVIGCNHQAQHGCGTGGAADTGMLSCHVASPGGNVLHKIDHGGIIFLALGGARCFGQKASVAARRRG